MDNKTDLKKQEILELLHELRDFCWLSDYQEKINKVIDFVINV